MACARAPRRRAEDLGGIAMKTSLRWTLLVVAALVLAAGLAAVIAKKRQASVSAVAPSASAAVERRLELSPQDLVRVARADLTRGIEVSGSLKAVNTAFVKARVAAELRSLTVREGDSVKPGQVLGQLDTTEFDWRLRQVEQQAAAAKAQLEIAQRQLANNKALVAQGFISPTALESSSSSEAAAQATLQAAIAAVELARKARADTTITAPIGGQVSQRLAQPGERVALDARLLEIVDLSRLELEASVPPAELESLRVGQAATLTIDGGSGQMQARVVRINPSAQPGSRSVAAYLALQPHPALRQGLFARGWIELEHRTTLLLPLAAVRTDLARPYAIRLQAGRTEQVTLTLGGRGLSAAGDEVVEVLQGLAEGDTVLAGAVGLVPEGVVVRLTGGAPASAPAKAAPPASSPATVAPPASSPAVAAR